MTTRKPSQPRPRKPTRRPAPATANPKRRKRPSVTAPRSAKAAASSRPSSASPYSDANRGTRLHRVLAEAGVASRRGCEELIREGRVSINGFTPTELPVWVDPSSDRIKVDGRVVVCAKRPSSKAPRSTCVILHKPRNVVTTTMDPFGKTTVTDLVELPPGLAKRLFPVGRLDADSAGLILLTDDGELANRVTHPRYGVPKEYRVSVRGHLSEEHLKKLHEGLYLAHRGTAGRRPAVKHASVAQVRIIGAQSDRRIGDRTQLALTLREGQNREVRRLLARLGFKVRRLQRVAIGPITLKGLGVGQWRLLETAEVNRLRQATGMGGSEFKPAGRQRRASPAHSSEFREQRRVGAGAQR